jgi:hypothetical protein
VIQYLSVWGEYTVCFHDDEARLVQIPARWTSLLDPDPFVDAAAGRTPLHIECLARLADLVGCLDAREDDRDCKPNSATIVNVNMPSNGEAGVASASDERHILRIFERFSRRRVDSDMPM